MPSPILKHFNVDHLPLAMRAIVRPFGELAGMLDSLLPDSAEKATALRKLLEASDCAARAIREKEGSM